MENRKHINLLLGIIYALVYDYVYTNYMYNYFSYMYCPDPSAINDQYFLYLTTAVIPLVFYKGFNSIASGISLFVYLIIYIPMLYITYIMNIDMTYKFQCILVLLIIVSLFFITDDTFLLKKWVGNPQKGKLSFSHIEIIGIVIFVIILISEQHNLKFVNIWDSQDELYDLRSSYSSKRNPIIIYLLSWIRTAILPLFIVYYLKKKQYVRYLIAFICYIVIFMIDMQKITLIMPFVTSIGYIGISKINFKRNFLTIIVGFFSILSIIITYFSYNFVCFKLGTIFIMRLQCLDSWLFCLYLNFFKNHPFTYYTHINIVNAITHAYPYNEALGYAVSNGQMNANASFLITDGYAALGITGFIIIGIIFIILKSIFNCTGLLINRNYLIIILFPAISSMLNVSLFTAILSCGFLLLYLIFKYVDLHELEEEQQ